MIKTSASVRPAVITNTLLGCSIILLGFHLFSSDFNNQISLAESRMQTATMQTIQELVDNSTPIISDEALLQNLNWDLNNSIQKSLSAYLKPSVIEQATIITANCDVVASISTQNFKSTPCEKLNLQKKLQWQIHSNIPTLSFIQPLMHQEKKLFLLSQVNLGEKWLDRFYPLKHSWSGLSLEFTEQSPTEFRQPFLLSGPGTYEGIAFTKINHPIFSLFPGRIFKQNQTLFIAIFLITIVLLINKLSKVWINFNDRKTEKLLLNFFDWFQTLKITIFQSPKNIQNVNKEFIQTLKEEIIKYVETKDKLIEKKQLSISELEEERNELGKRILVLKNTIDLMTDTKSLNYQINQASGLMRQSIDDLDEIAKDVESILSTGLTENGKSLLKFIQDWQLGIEQRGARKFLRSLSETESIHGYENMLDEQLHILHQYANSLTDQAVAANLHCHKLLHQSAKVNQVASHWNNMTNQEPQSDHSNTMEEMIQTFKSLIELDHKTKHISIKYDSKIKNPVINHAPKDKWVTGFYHILKALLHSDKHQEVQTLNISYKEKQSRSLIIFTTNQFSSLKLDLFHSDVKKQMQTSQNILKPFGIKCDYLYTTIGHNAPISLMWTNADMERTVPLPEIHEETNTLPKMV